MINNTKRVSLDLNEGIIDINSITESIFLKKEYFKLGTAVWHKIFKTSLIRENNIKFINYNEVSSEDTLFKYKAVLKSKKNILFK